MKKVLIFTPILIWLIYSLAYADRAIVVSDGSDFYSGKTALVIGNSAYRSSPLNNPRHDAEDMASLLSSLGFQVTVLTDSSRIQMMQAIGKFGRQLKQGGVGLFFFAGHGMQIKGKNYLIPVDADIHAEDEVQDYAVDAGMVLRKMQSAGNPLNMVFLDACRDNPFARSFRSSQKGLAQMDAPKGSLIVYATAPGSVAADGAGNNGVFTKNLMNHMKRPGVEIGMMLRDVRKDVLKETQDKQIPWESISLTGTFFFKEDSHPKGGISIQTQPSPSKITINGIFKGSSPLSLNLEPGVYTIEAGTENHQTKKETVRVRRGKHLNLTLVLEKSGGSLWIKSTPAQAGIYLNNIFYGQTPDTVKGL
ncbi:caspase family protein, partial [bacterium]|nr:caspase family protein [bacterium]